MLVYHHLCGKVYEDTGLLPHTTVKGARNQFRLVKFQHYIFTPLPEKCQLLAEQLKAKLSSKVFSIQTAIQECQRETVYSQYFLVYRLFLMQEKFRLSIWLIYDAQLGSKDCKKKKNFVTRHVALTLACETPAWRQQLPLEVAGFR